MPEKETFGDQEEDLQTRSREGRRRWNKEQSDPRTISNFWCREVHKHMSSPHLF